MVTYPVQALVQAMMPLWHLLSGGIFAYQHHCRLACINKLDQSLVYTSNETILATKLVKFPNTSEFLLRAMRMLPGRAIGLFSPVSLPLEECRQDGELFFKRIRPGTGARKDAISCD
jgi:hypothetical protein